MSLDFIDWTSVNIGSGNGLEPSGGKPLPEPMLAQVSVAIWRHYATMSFNHDNPYIILCLIWILSQNIEPESICPSFRRRHFHIHYRQWVSTKISQKFVPKGPNNNILALFRIMAWHQLGDKPLSEPVVVSLLTHICVTRPQWVKLNQVCVIYAYHNHAKNASFCFEFAYLYVAIFALTPPWPWVVAVTCFRHTCSAHKWPSGSLCHTFP